MIKNIKNLRIGDVLSESSHYTVESFQPGSANVLHHESGNIVNISMEYLAKMTTSCSLYDEEVKVTKEDRKDGTLGIRSIFEGINNDTVFTVCYTKQNTPKTKKKIQEEIDTIIRDFSNSIDTVKNNRQGVANAAKNLVTELINNPVLPYEEGEDRILRGYKVQFTSRDGKYNCMDMDIKRTAKESGIRPVNINTIKYLILNNVKYIVE